MKKTIFACFIILALSCSLALAGNVEYWGDGTIKSIDGESVSYWGDGTIKSIGN